MQHELQREEVEKELESREQRATTVLVCSKSSELDTATEFLQSSLETILKKLQRRKVTLLSFLFDYLKAVSTMSLSAEVMPQHVPLHDKWSLMDISWSMAKSLPFLHIMYQLVM